MIFVTGGNGFLGSHLLLRLTEINENIIALKRVKSDMEYTLLLFDFYEKKQNFEKIQWVTGDILDIHSLMNVLPENSYVFHCAALVSFDEKEKSNLIHINRKGTANMIEAALEKKTKKFCHVSSIAALGNDELITENTIWNSSEKHSAYSYSKYLSEMEVYRGIAEGLNAIIIQPSVIIGPWKKHAGIGHLFTAVEKNFKYFTKGVNGFVDVKDVVEIMIKLMQTEITNENFIISGENVSYQKLLSWIAQKTGNKTPNKEASKFHIETARRLITFINFFCKNKLHFNKNTAHISQTISHYSNKKISETLSFEFTSIKQSIEECYHFYNFIQKQKP